MNLKKIKAFTLVELIVVITILAILWTIAFISLQWYSKNARDSSRISDIWSLKTSLELFAVTTWNYPEPSGWISITYSWSQVWTQWTVWDSVITNLKQLSKIPTDPLTSTEYTYSRLNTKKEYQIGSILEWDFISWNISFQETFAADDKIATAYVTWNYNWLMAKVSSWVTTYILGVPTIINWDMDLLDIQQILDSKTLVYNWFQNLPSSYKWSGFNSLWGFNFWWNPLVYSWPYENLTQIGSQTSLINNLQGFYSWSLVENNNIINSILEVDVNSNTEVNEILSQLSHNWVGWVWNIQLDKKILKSVSDCTTSWELIYWTFDGTDSDLSCSQDIIVCDWVWSWYTIAACNAWATQVFSNQTFASPTTARDSGINTWAWWLYQWWNNTDTSYATILFSEYWDTTWFSPSTFNSPYFYHIGIVYDDWTSIQNDEIQQILMMQESDLVIYDTTYQLK